MREDSKFVAALAQLLQQKPLGEADIAILVGGIDAAESELTAYRERDAREAARQAEVRARLYDLMTAVEAMPKPAPPTQEEMDTFLRELWRSCKDCGRPTMSSSEDEECCCCGGCNFSREIIAPLLLLCDEAYPGHPAVAAAREYHTTRDPRRRHLDPEDMKEGVVLKYFLLGQEIDELLRLAATLSFEEGRQGTGYDKALVPTGAFKELREHSLRTLGVGLDQAHDCYLLRYAEGSSIPPHKDDAPFGSEHRRLNAVVQTAEEGGELIVEGKLVELYGSYAYAFRPDILAHEVSPVVKGVRLVWSVGVLV